MSFFEKFFKQKSATPKELTWLAKVVGSQLEKLAREILTHHEKDLASKPSSYVAAGVWGARKKGELSALQKDIQRRAEPVFRQIMDEMAMDGLEEAQEFAVQYMMRGLLIAKVCYLVEARKNQGIRRVQAEKKDREALYQMEPMGNA